ncbi:hypothetical protein DUI87_11336 [Hirundo rustica rustica]|uniref:Uncharacterized protein n=1 Tax=Hirundo rustica rustica TaxID=333673 RepID=A0A3M0KMJ8_HIRRU|nr:hypothetical protein DUI87_11336 [Hirundo rustica rustica]
MKKTLKDKSDEVYLRELEVFDMEERMPKGDLITLYNSLTRRCSQAREEVSMKRGEDEECKQGQSYGFYQGLISLRDLSGNSYVPYS